MGRNRKLPFSNRLSVPHRHNDQDRPSGQHNQLGLLGTAQNGSIVGLKRATNIVTVDIILIVISVRNLKIYCPQGIAKVVEVLTLKL